MFHLLYEAEKVFTLSFQNGDGLQDTVVKTSVKIL